MLTYDECLAMCDLTCDEIDAIAEHEHVDPMIALALGNYLVSHHEACEVKRFIVDDIEAARRSGNTEKMILLKQTFAALSDHSPLMPAREAIAKWLNQIS